MTKQEEIKLLEELAVKLGKDSYMGSWFKDQLPFMITTIETDMPPEVRCLSFGEAVSQRVKMIDDAKGEANRITERAEEQSLKIVAEAHKKANGITERAISSIRKILKELEN